MNLYDIISTAVAELGKNKSRSALTILGIVVGITSVILVVSLGEGAQNLILGQIQGLGSKTIVIIPGRQPSGPSDVAQLFSDSLKLRDVEELSKKSNAPHIAEIMPVVFGGESASFEGETFRLTLFGATPLISKIFDLNPAEGSFFTEDDVRTKADVVVIGSRVADELFGAEDAVGKRIRIKNRNFRVAGVLPRKGQVSFFNFDEIAIVPYTSAQQNVFGIKHLHRIIVEAESEEHIRQTVRDIQATLRHTHGITDSSKDDFFVETPGDIIERLGVITTILTLFLASVAAISLIVGGIGIMNIMLVSVTERTREIGLRKAVGAKKRDILMQFLAEAVILTGIGGILGVVLGAGLSALAGLIIGKVAGLDWIFSFPLRAAVIGMTVASLTGLVFGLYPARQAAEKNPIDSLRYE